MGAVGRIDGAWLRRERTELVALLRGLDGDQWRLPTECPAWDVHGVALHVLGDDLSLLSRQRDAATNGLILFAKGRPASTFRELLDGFNERWVTAAAFFSPQLTIDLLEQAGEWTATFYEEVDPESPGEPVAFLGATGSSPYWHAISREFVERWVHQHQIRRAVGAPDLDDAHLGAAAAVVVSAIGARLGDVGLPEGTTFAIEIEGVRRWTLRRDSGRWNVADDPTGDAVAALTADPATAVSLFSRSRVVPRPGLRAHGDPDVGGAIVAALAPIFD